MSVARFELSHNKKNKSCTGFEPVHLKLLSAINSVMIFYQILMFTHTKFQFLEAVASKIPAKWRKVGLSLGISSSILDGIEKHRRGDCLECFSDVFTCWQQQSTPRSPANWTSLVAVLRSNSVGEEELSDTIQNTFM